MNTIAASLTSIDLKSGLISAAFIVWLNVRAARARRERLTKKNRND